MVTKRYQSLSVKLLVLTAVWVSFVVGVLGYTLYLGEATESTAGLAEHVGEIQSSVRRALRYDPGLAPGMRDAEIRESGRMIEQLGASRPVFSPGYSPNMLATIAEVSRMWKEEVLPEFEESRRKGTVPSTGVTGRFYQALEAVRHAVAESRSEQLFRMHVLQGMIMALAIASLFVILYLLNRWVIRPVSAIGEGIDKVAGGDLKARIPISGQGELSEIARGFNRMAERLEDLYNNLETKVAEKTASVQEKNQNLQQLYDMTTFLSQRGTYEEICEGFLERVRSCCQADGCLLRLLDESNRSLQTQAFSGVSGQFLGIHRSAGMTPRLRRVMERCLPERVDLQTAGSELAGRVAAAGFRTAYAFPVHSGPTPFGVFEIYYRDDTDISPSEFRQLEAFGAHLGVSIENQRLSERDRLYAVTQERSLMARGLHDSIAQTLSFLNLQVQLLESSLQNNDRATVDETVGLLKAGVHESYENVRELLLNFREKLHNEPFGDALVTVVKRFEAQSGVKAGISVSGSGPELTEKQKLQVMFILQEALSNVRKHAEASKVEVRVENNDDFVAIVSDNGNGIDEKLARSRRESHVGLSIMEERARKINAVLEIGSNPDGGTWVRVTLPAKERTLG